MKYFTICGGELNMYVFKGIVAQDFSIYFIFLESLRCFGIKRFKTSKWLTKIKGVREKFKISTGLSIFLFLCLSKHLLQVQNSDFE